MDKRIGEKVKKLRTRQHMTLKDLSERTNLSISHLSQFERGVSAMSLYSLERVAEALGKSFSYFMELAEPSPRREYEHFCLRSYDLNSVDIPYNDRIYNRLGNRLTECVLEPMVVTLHPQERQKNLYPKPHRGEEFVYVLEGILTLLIDNEECTLYPGDSMHYLASAPHEWLNLTTQAVRLVSVNTPRILSSQPIQPDWRATANID